MTSTEHNGKMRADTNRAQLMVEESALILKRFYFLQRELVMMQAGWLPGVSSMPIKLLLPEFLWQDALIANELRARVLELRYPLRQIDMAPDDGLIALFRSLRDAPNGTAFACGLAGAAKPLLREAYQRYIDRCDHLDDGPTLRILHQAVRDIDEQLARWSGAIHHSPGTKTAAEDLTSRWLAGLDAWRSAIGDLLSPHVKTGQFVPDDSGGRLFQISRIGQRDPCFQLVRFAWPDRLDPAFGTGEGLRLQVRQAVHHVNEVWAAEMAGACLFDLADQADHAFLVDAARWCYDEIRHCRMGYTRLKEWGFTESQIPLDSFSYDAGALSDAITRLGIIFYFESTYIHTKSQRKKIFGEFGDHVSSHDMDFDWADEQIHAHYGTRWLKYFLEKQHDPRKPIEFREVAESLVKTMQRSATEQDRQQTMVVYERMMSQAAELAARGRVSA
jgi:uncharacterized ferritin-like protein (DUF455 family)